MYRREADYEAVPEPSETFTSENAFREGLVSSFTMILLAEIADKTFFIAAIMAMRYNKLIVFMGAWSALVLMTALSVAMGFLATLVPQYITHIVAGCLFLLFAGQMFYEAFKMRGQSDAAQKEMEEVSRELREDDEELRVRFRKDSKSEDTHGSANFIAEIVTSDADQARNRGQEGSAGSLNKAPGEASINKISCTTKTERFLALCCNAIFIKAFILTFVAEWGDRSQLSTVTLAVSTDPFAVFLGGSAGHFICTSLAIIFGALIAKRVSLSILNLCGAVIFIGFAGYSFYLAYSEYFGYEEKADESLP